MKDNLLVGAGVMWGSQMTVAYTGVASNVLIACVIGTFCAFSVNEKVEPRRAMLGLFICCVFMGAAFTSVVNFLLVHSVKLVMTDGLQAGVGCIVAFLTRPFLPWVVDVVRTGKWLAWVPFINRGSRDQ